MIVILINKMMDALIFTNIYKLADAATKVNMVKSIRDLSHYIKHIEIIKLPVKFTIDNNSNVYFIENNTQFTIFATYNKYHNPINKNTHIYISKMNILIDEEIILKCDHKYNVIRTKYDSIIGILKKI